MNVALKYHWRKDGRTIKTSWDWFKWNQQKINRMLNLSRSHQRMIEKQHYHLHLLQTSLPSYTYKSCAWEPIVLFLTLCSVDYIKTNSHNLTLWILLWLLWPIIFWGKTVSYYTTNFKQFHWKLDKPEIIIRKLPICSNLQLGEY